MLDINSFNAYNCDIKQSTGFVQKENSMQLIQGEELIKSYDYGVVKAKDKHSGVGSKHNLTVTNKRIVNTAMADDGRVAVKEIALNEVTGVETVACHSRNIVGAILFLVLAAVLLGGGVVSMVLLGKVTGIVIISLTAVFAVICVFRFLQLIKLRRCVMVTVYTRASTVMPLVSASSTGFKRNIDSGAELQIEVAPEAEEMVNEIRDIIAERSKMYN